MTSANFALPSTDDQDPVADLFSHNRPRPRRVQVAPPRPLPNSPLFVRLDTSPVMAQVPAPPVPDAVSTEAGWSPTTTVYQAMISLAVALTLGLLLGARGVVHAGEGMPEGTERTLTLMVGQVALDISEHTGLIRPWDALQTALGRAPRPHVGSLLTGNTQPSGSNLDSQPHLASLPFRTHRAQSEWAFVPTVKAHPSRQRLRRPSAKFPLRLLVTGDSLTEYLAAQLVSQASAVGPIRGFEETHYGTGLARPDFVDWSVLAQQQESADNPDAVVVMMGGNDFQSMSLPSGQIVQASTSAWVREYQRRAEICMRIWARGGSRRVYWLSIPPARDAAWATADANMNKALQRAASHVRGAHYLDVLGPITNHGRYGDFVPDAHGQPILVRTPDGVHLTQVGSAIVAREVLQALRNEWHF